MANLWELPLEERRARQAACMKLGRNHTDNEVVPTLGFGAAYLEMYEGYTVVVTITVQDEDGPLMVM